MKPILVRKKPLVVEAALWLGPNQPFRPGALTVDELMEWGAKIEPTQYWSVDGHPEQWSLRLWIEPEKAWINVPVGFWIIKGVVGEFYPCAPEVFAQTYEREDTRPEAFYLRHPRIHGAFISGDGIPTKQIRAFVESMKREGWEEITAEEYAHRAGQQP